MDSSAINEALQGYAAGRVKAERLVIAVATAYYGREGVRGIRDGLGPLIEIIDRASPGVIRHLTARATEPPQKRGSLCASC